MRFKDLWFGALGLFLAGLAGCGGVEDYVADNDDRFVADTTFGDDTSDNDTSGNDTSGNDTSDNDTSDNDSTDADDDD
ncbi:MAG: hypothetical protein CL928_18585, partial [Deltaproteobacteria bacterium]|nr:hypothetical protein [Deltaproteobacteria bacterium]